jgi:hypothetical protein
MAKQDTSAVRRCPVRPVGAYFLDNDRRSIHYPLLIFEIKLFNVDLVQEAPIGVQIQITNTQMKDVCVFLEFLVCFFLNQ